MIYSRPKIVKHVEHENRLPEAQVETGGEIGDYILSIINEKYSDYLEYKDDLFQVGYLGVMKAQDSYDSSKYSSKNYFYYFIVHEIEEFINTMILKTTHHYAETIKKITSAIDKYEDQGIAYTADDISITAGKLSLGTTKAALAIKNNADVIYYGNTDYLDSHMSERSDSLEVKYLEKEKIAELHKAINELEPKEWAVISLIYGFRNQTYSIRAAANLLNLSIGKVKGLHKKALEKIDKNPNLREILGVGEEKITEQNDFCFNTEYIPVQDIINMNAMINDCKNDLEFKRLLAFGF